MTTTTIILIIIGVIYALGTLFQAISTGLKENFNFFEIIVSYLFTLVIGVVIMPMTWLISLDETIENPMPRTFTYTLNDDTRPYYKAKIKALGFLEKPYRISVDNIPYSGFVYKGVGRDDWIIIAIDKTNQETYLRVSVYKNNKTTKIITKQLDDLFRLRYEGNKK